MLVAAWLLGTPLHARAESRLTTHVTARSGALVDELQAWNGALLPRRRLVQELIFAAYHESATRRGRVALVGTLRVQADFGLTAEEAASLQPSPAAGLEVPVLYVRARDPVVGLFEATVGRQVRWADADLLLMDGVRLQLVGAGPLGGDVFAGTLVRREISFAGVDELGPPGPALTDSTEPTFGGSVFLREVSWLGLGLGYRQDRGDGDATRSLLSMQAALRPHPAGRLHTHWTREMVWQQDERLGVSLRGEVSRWLSYAVEWERQQPRIPANSVFAVFGALPEHRLGLGAELHQADWQLGLRTGLVCQAAACGDLPWDLAEAGPPLGVALDAFAALQPSARWGLFARGGASVDGAQDGRRSLSVGGRITPGPRHAVIEAQVRWVHIEDGVGAWARGELFAADLSGALRVWERARLMAVLQQASGPTQPWWSKVLLLLDMEYWL